jgi:hypothetical protein
VFAFHIALSINRHEIDDDLFKFLLTGFSTIQVDESLSPPELKLSEKTWHSFRQLCQLKGFESVMPSVQSITHEWADFINKNRDIPSEFDDMDDFKKILICKILKPEKAQSKIQNYVLQKLGEFYAYPPINTIKDSF